MNQTLAWLKKTFVQPHDPITANQRGNGVNTEPEANADGDYESEHSHESDVHCPIDGQDCGKNTLAPDTNSDGHVAAEPKLRIFDLRSPGVDNSVRSNPYDSDNVKK